MDNIARIRAEHGRRRKVLLAVIIGAIFFISTEVWAIWNSLGEDAGVKDYALLGDAVGGVFGSLLSAISVVVISWALFFQMEELALTREEIVASNKTRERSFLLEISKDLPEIEWRTDEAGSGRAFAFGAKLYCNVAHDETWTPVAILFPSPAKGRNAPRFEAITREANWSFQTPRQFEAAKLAGFNWGRRVPDGNDIEDVFMSISDHDFHNAQLEEQGLPSKRRVSAQFSCDFKITRDRNATVPVSAREVYLVLQSPIAPYKVAVKLVSNGSYSIVTLDSIVGPDSFPTPNSSEIKKGDALLQALWDDISKGFEKEKMPPGYGWSPLVGLTRRALEGYVTSGDEELLRWELGQDEIPATMGMVGRPGLEPGTDGL